MPFQTGLISNPDPDIGFLYGSVASPALGNQICGNINGWLTAAGNNLTAPILNGAASGTSAPTATPVAYALYKELVPTAVARISNPAGTATLARGINISSVTRAALGTVDIVLIVDGADMTNAVITATVNSVPARFASASVVVGSPNKIRVQTYDNTGTAVDSNFFVSVWAW